MTFGADTSKAYDNSFHVMLVEGGGKYYETFEDEVGIVDNDEKRSKTDFTQKEEFSLLGIHSLWKKIK